MPGPPDSPSPTGLSKCLDPRRPAVFILAVTFTFAITVTVVSTLFNFYILHREEAAIPIIIASKFIAYGIVGFAMSILLLRRARKRLRL